ncbi:TPA: hypothetical protein DDZ86_01315 [Candidatus Dependentiae bacterium]|nr:MAG: Outer membrane protein [candidate division TM6 bacterium GW2011_GWF2_43_87]HBL98265.1 hypothetical protein [Candidatus Dependentiae bacterium]
MKQLIKISTGFVASVCILQICAADEASKKLADKTEKVLESAAVKPVKTPYEKTSFCEKFGCSCTKLKPHKKPVITISGFVDAEHCFDTRQVYGSRDGEGFYYPREKDLVACGVDANKQGSFSMFPFNVRLLFQIEGDPVANMKRTYAFIGTDFRGTADTTIELLRMREAYIVLDWERTQILAGQKLHPFCSDDCNPNTVSYSKGGPMEIYTYIPIVRLTQTLNGTYEKPADQLFLILAGGQCPATQSKSPLTDAPGATSTTVGTASAATTLVGRNSVMPIMQAQWRHYFGKENYFGVTIEGQRLRPRLKTVGTGSPVVPYAEKCSAFTECMCAAYMKLTSECAILRAKLAFIQDGSELGFISGYAVEDQASVSKRQKYTPLRSIASWFDVDFWPDQEWMPGAVIGFAKNFGAGKKLWLNANGQPTVYTSGPVSVANPGGTGATIDTLFKFAPRLWIKKGPVHLGLEFDWTRAAFGKLDEYGAVYGAVPVNNFRLQFSIFYRF